MSITFNKSTLLLTGSLLFAGIAHADYVLPQITHDAYGHQKVVYQLNSGDPDIQAKALKYMLNNISAAKDIEGVVVVFDDGMGALTDNDPKVVALLDKVRAKHVKIAVCNNTLKGKNLDWHSLYNVQETDIVPSGVAEIGFLQSKGYTYLKP